MDPDLLEEFEQALEKRWPNWQALTEQWIIRDRVVFYVSDHNGLDVIRPKLPTCWRDAVAIDYKEWFFSDTNTKGELATKYLILTHIQDFTIPLSIPAGSFIKAKHCISQSNGEVKDVKHTLNF